MRYLVDTNWVIHFMHDVARVANRLEQLTPAGDCPAARGVIDSA